MTKALQDGKVPIKKLTINPTKPVVKQKHNWTKPDQDEEEDLPEPRLHEVSKLRHAKKI